MPIFKLMSYCAFKPEYHIFGIISPTADSGIFSNEEISRLDFMDSWHSFTVPRWYLAPDSDLYFHKHS